MQRDRLGPAAGLVGFAVAAMYTGLSVWAAFGKVGSAFQGWFGLAPNIGGWIGVALIALFAFGTVVTSPRWKRVPGSQNQD